MKLEQAARQVIDAWNYGSPLEKYLVALDEALAEQEQNSMFMEGYRIGLAEMREKCATVSEQGTGEAIQKAALELLLNERKRIAAAIRSIKFEGDTGFRPASEMVSDHFAAPVRTKDLTDDEIQMLWVNWDANRTVEWYECIEDLIHIVEDYIKENQMDAVCAAAQPVREPVGYIDAADLRELCNGNERQYSLFTEDKGRMVAIYTAPVRTKDLTDDEIATVYEQDEHHHGEFNYRFDHVSFARAVIAADREKNK